jgi:hypothetical protein
MASLIVPSDLPDSLSSRSDIVEIIVAVSKLAEQFCRRTFSREVNRVETHSGGDYSVLFLRLTPVESIASITHDGQTVSAFMFDPTSGKVQRGDGRGHIDFADWFPAGTNNIVITYTGGFARIPDEVKSVVKIGVANYVRELGRDAGLKSENIGGEYSWAAKDDDGDPYRIFGNAGKAILRGFRRSGKTVIG